MHYLTNEMKEDMSNSNVIIASFGSQILRKVQNIIERKSLTH